MSYWRERSAEVITRVLKETRGQSEKEIRTAVSKAYPFGERRNYPYKAWLKECNKRLGTRKPRKKAAELGSQNHTRQIGLFGGGQ